MFIAHLFGEESGSFNSINEVFLFLFYVVGVFLGMILSWKWEGIGGIMGTVSIIAFHLIEPKFYLFQIILIIPILKMHIYIHSV